MLTYAAWAFLAGLVTLRRVLALIFVFIWKKLAMSASYRHSALRFLQ